MRVDHRMHRTIAGRNRVGQEIVEIFRAHIGAVARIGRRLAHDAFGRVLHQRQQRGVLLPHRHMQPGRRIGGGDGGIERDIQHKRQPEHGFENHPVGLANQSLQHRYQRRSRAARET
jgi:hypothetical protein